MRGDQESTCLQGTLDESRDPLGLLVVLRAIVVVWSGRSQGSFLFETWMFRLVLQSKRGVVQILDYRICAGERQLWTSVISRFQQRLFPRLHTMYRMREIAIVFTPDKLQLRHLTEQNVVERV